MDEPIIVGIDVGTTKICTLIGRVEGDNLLRILGVGIEPSRGLNKGTIVDLHAASQAIARSIEKAERTSGLEIDSALVSMAGSQVETINSKGVGGVSGRTIDEEDVVRALDAARAITIPHNREVIHVIQRGFVVDGQEGIRVPIGMHGYRLEVEAHIITASAASVENLRQAVLEAGPYVSQFVLNPLASAEVVLTETEREMGVVVCDIGGGTTDMAIYINGDVWHTSVLGVGGNHITSDIAHGLRLPIPQAEDTKLQHGYAIRADVSEEEYFLIRPFGEEGPVKVSRSDLAHIIEARVGEIFSLMLQEIKRSGYDGLLPAGMVLTGGVSSLPGIRKLASQVMGIPVKVAQPEGMVGMVDQLYSPAYTTGVGLLRWAMLMRELPSVYIPPTSNIGGADILDKIKKFFHSLMP